MNEVHIRELFREMRDEPVPPDSRARVRIAVAERTVSWRERWRRPTKVAAAILLPACAILLALLPHTPARTTLPLKQPVAQQAALQMPEVPIPHRVPKPSRHRVTRAVIARHEPPTTTIRIETPDPDIVIVLLGS